MLIDEEKLRRMYYDESGKILPWGYHGPDDQPPGERDGTTGTYRSDGYPRRSGRR